MPKQTGQSFFNFRAMQKIQLPFQNVIITILLSLVTLGIYIPVWFIINRKGINNLVEGRQFSMTGPIILLVLSGFGVIISLLSMFAELFGEAAALNNYYENIENLVDILGWIWSIVLAFQVQSIIKEYTQRNQYEVGYIGFFTFLFGIYYLQYKVNQIIRYEDEQVWDIDSIGQHLEEEEEE